MARRDTTPRRKGYRDPTKQAPNHSKNTKVT